MTERSIVTLSDGLAVTTTVAIADGTGIQHKNVIELVRTYLSDLEEFGGVAFETRSFVTTGGAQWREIAILNEQQSTLLLTYMRNSDIVRAFKKRLVKAFWAMTERLRTTAVAIPQTLPDALRLAADLADQKAQAEAALAIAAPKAVALDRIAAADGSLCLTDAAKELQVRPKDLIGWLSCNQWIYKRAGGANWIGYQDRIQSGLLEHKSNIVIDGDGRERIRDQVRVTAKGLASLAGSVRPEASW